MYYFRNGKRNSDDARGNGNPAGRRDGIFGQMSFKATNDYNLAFKQWKGSSNMGPRYKQRQWKFNTGQSLPAGELR